MVGGYENALMSDFYKRIFPKHSSYPFFNNQYAAHYTSNNNNILI